MEEVKRAIAFLFRRKGSDSMTETDFVMSASMDLRWFAPKDAQRLMQIGLDSKLLVIADGKVRPSFDVAGVEVPLDYAPPATLLDVQLTPPSVFVKAVDRMQAATKLERRKLVSMINSTQAELDIDIEVAALIVGRELDVDVSDLLDEAEKVAKSRLR